MLRRLPSRKSVSPQVPHPDLLQGRAHVQQGKEEEQEDGEEEEVDEEGLVEGGGGAS